MLSSCYPITNGNDNMRKTLELVTNNKEEWKEATINLIPTATWETKKTSGYSTRTIPWMYACASASNKWCCKILGADVMMLDEHQASVWQTKSRDCKLSMKHDMCNQLKHITDFWKEHYPDNYDIGVCELTEEELTDPDKFFTIISVIWSTLA